jgi:1-aminocyclopropane-1-carboxylate deaminase/D-cysteine desulfhydrase-like pyridoxal-dependent ACC family enzyme
MNSVRVQPGPGGRIHSVDGTSNYTELMFGALDSLPSVPFAPGPTPVETLERLGRALGTRARLLVKRDDAIAFAFGGNKVRKMRLVAAAARDRGADTLITTGGVQSNHARVTAAAAAKLGMRCILVVNGERPSRPSANALLDELLGADIVYVAAREDRTSAMERAAEAVRRAGRTPYVIPLGASNPLGATAFVGAVAELARQIDPPDVIIHSTSSGGTQAGLAAGCALAGWRTHVVGISADDPSSALTHQVRALFPGIAALLGFEPRCFDGCDVRVDDAFVGEGYGISTAASREAIELAARTEALFLDPTYTAKAMAGLIARARAGDFENGSTVLFWHTGGQVGLFV